MTTKSTKTEAALTKPVRIDALKTEVWARAVFNEKAVKDYAEAMGEGDRFPPVVVFDDRRIRWLADGHHRVEAARRAGHKEILAQVLPGGQREALLHAIQANARDGVPLTAADRRRAVETLLRDREWCGWSDRQIARHCGVDHKTVGAARAQLQGNGEIPQSAKRKEVRAGRVRERTVKPRSGGAKLTADDIREIRADPRNGQEIADQYRISKSLVSKIRSNQIYTDPEYVPAFAGLRRAWDHADEEACKKFARWLWSNHREMIEAVIAELSPQSVQRGTRRRAA